MRENNKDYHVLIIYDIVKDKRRNKFAEFLCGYGYRIQKSCFEAIISKKLYKQILDEIPKFYEKKEDSVRIYRLNEGCSITSFGLPIDIRCERAEII